MQDWLNIRSFDPRRPVWAAICALRGAHIETASDLVGEVAAKPVLIRPGVERC